MQFFTLFRRLLIQARIVLRQPFDIVSHRRRCLTDLLDQFT